MDSFILPTVHQGYMMHVISLILHSILAIDIFINQYSQLHLIGIEISEVYKYIACEKHFSPAWNKSFIFPKFN